MRRKFILSGVLITSPYHSGKHYPDQLLGTQVLSKMSTVCIMHTVHAQRLPRAPSKSPLVKIREMGLAIVHMAEEQMAMEQRLNSRLDNAVIAFKNWMLV